VGDVVLFTGSQALRGGTERACADVSILLASQGHSVTILSQNNGLHSFYALPKKIKLSQLKANRRRGAVHAVYTMWLLFKYIRRNKPEVVVAVESLSFLFLMPLYLLYRRPIIVNWEHFNAGVTLGVRTRTLARRLSVWLADKIIVISDRDRKLWIKHFNCPDHKIERIYNVNPFDSVSVTEGSCYLKRSKIVVAAGRLTAQKGFDLLIYAWSEVPHYIRDGWVLKICGDGPDRDSLVELIKLLGLQDQVILAGHVQDIRQEYLHAQLFVLSSRFEGFGLVVLEALTCGLPVVSFDCIAGPSEIIEDGIDGLLVSPENIDELAKGIKQLLVNDPARLAMAQAAVSYRIKFGTEKISAQWQYLLESLTGAQPGP